MYKSIPHFLQAMHYIAGKTKSLLNLFSGYLNVKRVEYYDMI